MYLSTKSRKKSSKNDCDEIQQAKLMTEAQATMQMRSKK